MITTEEIAVVAYNMLIQSDVASMISGQIDYERNDYTKEDVIIIPHTIQGEGSNHPRLIAIRKAVINVLKNHYESGEGWNWYIGRLNPPIKEQGHDEHFVSLALEITVRNKKSNV